MMRFTESFIAPNAVTLSSVMMTNEQKLDALVELLGDVIHTLNLKQYCIDDPTESDLCEVEADEFHAKMISILHND